MTTKADIILIAPELSGLSDSTFSLAIADAELYINSSLYGSLADLAKRYFAAHCLAVWTASPANASGAVASEKAGRVEVRYQVNANMSREFLGMTKYGQMVIDLRQKKILPAMVV